MLLFSIGCVDVTHVVVVSAVRYSSLSAPLPGYHISWRIARPNRTISHDVLQRSREPSASNGYGVNVGVTIRPVSTVAKVKTHRRRSLCSLFARTCLRNTITKEYDKYVTQDVGQTWQILSASVPFT